MAMLDEARADDKPFPAGLTTVLMTLTHDHSAMLRYFAVRLNVADARQLPRDSEQRSIIVQGRDDLCREARTQVRAPWRNGAKSGCELDADPELEVCRRQDFWKYY